jgi:hypothetical protein
VSFDGIADFISNFSTFMPQSSGVTGRYEEGPLALFGITHEESGYRSWEGRRGNTRTNTFAIARFLTTPVLIINGDWDYVPIQQGEEFFTALWRLNKPARFVRYWGEATN